MNYKKSELSLLAQMVKEDVFESYMTGEIEVILTFTEKGEETRVSNIYAANNPINTLELMQVIRKKLSNLLFLKVNKMNLEIKINDNKVNPNLFGIESVFTGKKVDRYRVFNSWFIVAMAAHLSIEVNPTGNEC